MRDVLAEQPYLFLGSRLKRLAERMQTDAGRIIRKAGLDFHPAQSALLFAIDRYGPLTIGDLVQTVGWSQPAVTKSAAALADLGLLHATKAGSDQRQKSFALTPEGRAQVAQARGTVWHSVETAVTTLCADLTGTLIEQISMLEAALDDQSLEERASQLSTNDGSMKGLSIRDYSDELAEAFYRINEDWIGAMFTMEENDRVLLSNPRELIIDRGGVILFVEAPGLGIVGTCALVKIDDQSFELTKMGVLKSARGRKAGEFLLRAILQRASEMRINKIYLLTNRKCAPAIHLYEKLGFEHDAHIMKTYGARYARCDVAMLFRGNPGRTGKKEAVLF